MMKKAGIVSLPVATIAMAANPLNTVNSTPVVQNFVTDYFSTVITEFGEMD